ncbi:MAG TPA: RNase adapter RapZ [Steroidobacteraceae bacterium]|nr:RNase adapter RapZ [Steroidobacteraceae bacterium]
MRGSAMRLVIVSGLSGSGKSVALNMLEDLGWYCVDNIPAGLLNAFIAHSVRRTSRVYERSAVGLDARNEPDEIASVPQMVRELRKSGIGCEIIYLHADEAMLIRRYGETRRRHPLVRERVDLKAAIAEELRLLEPITYSADLVIDTSHTSVHELREMVRARIDQRRVGRLSIMFESFGYKHGIPDGADFVFDARTLPNPYWDPVLQSLTGRDPAVIAFLEAHTAVQELLADMIAFLDRRIPLYQQHNRGYLTVAVGCTGGQHRSVFLVERLAAHFAARYPDVVARHGSLRMNP